MTSLERDLAQVLELAEQARASGNGLALMTLMQRKQAICAALAASEHGWYPPPALESDQRHAVAAASVTKARSAA